MQWEGVHALVQLAKTGDEQAWQRLCAMAQPYLLRLAQRSLGPDWPTQSVSDLLQGTWLRAWQGMAGFRGGNNDTETGPLLRDWLARTLKNVRSNDRRFAQAARRKMPPGTVSVDAANGDSAAGGFDLRAVQPSPSTNLRAEERTTIVQQALSQLSDPKDREIIRLSFLRCAAWAAQSSGRVSDGLGEGLSLTRWVGIWRAG
jgi:RNA polymerase sigma factor (sigma-70 family)